jgi:hypothetical protein
MKAVAVSEDAAPSERIARRPDVSRSIETDVSLVPRAAEL